MRLGLGALALGFETFADNLIGCLAVEHALAAGVVGGIEAAQQLFKILVRIDGNAQHLAADTAIAALHHAIGLWCVGLVWRYCAPSSAQTLAKTGVKQLPLSVTTWVRRNGKAAAASRRKAMALCSVSSSLTARWTEREQRSMAT